MSLPLYLVANYLLIFILCNIQIQYDKNYHFLVMNNEGRKRWVEHISVYGRKRRQILEKLQIFLLWFLSLPSLLLKNFFHFIFSYENNRFHNQPHSDHVVQHGVCHWKGMTSGNRASLQEFTAQAFNQLSLFSRVFFAVLLCDIIKSGKSDIVGENVPIRKDSWQTVVNYG